MPPDWPSPAATISSSPCGRSICPSARPCARRAGPRRTSHGGERRLDLRSRPSRRQRGAGHAGKVTSVEVPPRPISTASAHHDGVLRAYITVMGDAARAPSARRRSAERSAGRRRDQMSARRAIALRISSRWRGHDRRLRDAVDHVPARDAFDHRAARTAGAVIHRQARHARVCVRSPRALPDRPLPPDTQSLGHPPRAMPGSSSGSGVAAAAGALRARWSSDTRWINSRAGGRIASWWATSRPMGW